MVNPAPMAGSPVATPAGKVVRPGGGASRTGVFQATPPAPQELLARALTRSLGQPLASGNSVLPLFEAAAADTAVRAALEEARDHVNLAGRVAGAAPEALARLVAGLAACAKAGVRVNLLLDGWDERAPWPAVLEPLRRPGITLCGDGGPTRRLGIALAGGDRQPLLVVDGRLAFVDHVVAPVAVPAGPWQVAALRVEGPLVAQLQSVFVERWRRVAERPMQPGRHFPPLPPVGAQRVGLAACETGRGPAPLRQALHSALGVARQRIVLAARHGDPGRELLAALAAAAERGVAVRLLRAPGAGRRPPGLPASVVVHDRDAGLGAAPSNLCVVDGVWCALGATRLDGRGWLHEAAAGLVVLDAGFGARLEALFDAEAARGADAPARPGGGRRAWIGQRFVVPL